jgi:CheY-like chemotaxis protein
MDINMPRMNGLEATRVIRSEAPECDVIIVTQNEAMVAREQARRADAHGFVTKSDLARDLLPTIEKFRSAKPEAHEANIAQGRIVQWGG